MLFQQDSATSHTANDILTALKTVFGDRTTGYGLCLARLTDLSVCNFYFWGHVQHKSLQNESPHVGTDKGKHTNTNLEFT